MSKNAIHVSISGAAGQIGYSLIPLIAGGKVFGPEQPVILQLLDITPSMKALNGVAMEIQDCSYPLVKDVICTDDPEVAFKDAQAVVLLGGFPRKAGMERKDLLDKNSPIFIGQGQALNKVADRNVKVLVVANPANTNCLVLSTNAPDIPKENFSAMTRLDQNRARFQIANKLGAEIGAVSNVCIWGNHSSTQYPSIAHGTVTKDGVSRPLTEALKGEEKWLEEEFIPTVQNRGAAIIGARGLSSAMSAANAAANHMRDWFNGSDGEYVSMAVHSDGSYGVAKGIFFSFPVVCAEGTYKIVQGLDIDEGSQKRISATETELLEEKKDALGSA